MVLCRQLEYISKFHISMTLGSTRHSVWRSLSIERSLIKACGGEDKNQNKNFHTQLSPFEFFDDFQGSEKRWPFIY